MADNKSQNQLIKMILVALLRDVQTLHSGVFSPEALRLTVAKTVRRLNQEGCGFATKSLPRLGKMLDKALAGSGSVDAEEAGFKPQPDSKLPLFMGELFNCVLSKDGKLLNLPKPCAGSVKSLRQILYSFYKYELPYDPEVEASVVERFRTVEAEVVLKSSELQEVATFLDANRPYGFRAIRPEVIGTVIRRARILLSRLFANFDIHDIHPRHGPGAVSTRETLHQKWQWTSVSPRIAEVYPIDAYLYASLSHVCDVLHEPLARGGVGPQLGLPIEWREDPARVCLVPKDSRGPRLISCEPLGNQWFQQGLGRAIMRHVEQHPLTKDNVHFTDQSPNQIAALYGSQNGRYATLDLNDASDRVSLGLVNLLFPEPLLSALLACRSLATVLPSGEVLKLEKFAPMGSALCFPILSLTVWALLTAGCTDTDTRESILVFGDDVIVPSGYVTNAIWFLEALGLKVNRDKSCFSGSFRESCGMDAFAGTPVTPVRFRTVWTSHRSPEALQSFAEYANALYERKYFYTYEFIAGELFRSYGTIPESEDPSKEGFPALYEVPRELRPKTRVNPRLQRREQYVWFIRPCTEVHEIYGWHMLHRYLNRCPHEAGTANPFANSRLRDGINEKLIRRTKWDLAEILTDDSPLFRVRNYTRPRASKLARGWR